MRRLAPVLGLLTLVAVLAAGCGSGGALALDPVAAAATKTQEAGTFAFDYTASIQIFGHTVSLDGSGKTDTSTGAGQMSLSFAGMPGTANAGAQMLIVDKTVYVQSSQLAGKLPSGKQWLKVDVSRLAAAKGQPLGSLNEIDPQQWLQQLLASKDTQKLGTDTVQGETMTHYRATVDLSQAAKGKARDSLSQLGVSSLPVDIWVDGQGLVRQVQTSLSLSKQLQGTSFTLTFDMHDFGTPVSVTAPPADEVYDATSSLGSLGH